MKKITESSLKCYLSLNGHLRMRSLNILIFNYDTLRQYFQLRKCFLHKMSLSKNAVMHQMDASKATKYEDQNDRHQ